MPHIFGRKWKKTELRQRVGELSQLGGIERAVLDDGPARGLRVARLRTGTGLEAEILLDRCLDIGRAYFQGAALAYRTCAGDVHPAYYDPRGLSWIRSFAGGLLTTCGLTQAGSPCTDNGEELGLHGRISNAPASEVNVHTEWRGDELHFSVSGVMREAALFGPNLSLRRRISSQLGSNTIEIRDVVKNEGFAAAPLMLLYHCNLGFPLVDNGSRLLVNSTVTPRDKTAAKGVAACAQFEAPQAGYQEQVFYHDVAADKTGRVRAALIAPPSSPPLAVVFEYNKKALPVLVEWKMMGQGAYVVGFEPANCHVGGRAAERAAKTLQYLEPGEEKTVNLKITVVADLAGVQKLREKQTD